MTLKRTIELLKEYLRMNNFIELTNVNKYRLDEINKIRDYFNNEIKEIGTGISKSLLKLTKRSKKKHNKIIVLAKNKLNMIDTLLSSALNDSEISHEEFANIINEANIYENIKENITKLTIEPSSLERKKL